MVNTLQGKSWVRLLSRLVFFSWCELRAYEINRVGEDVLLHLFTETSVFIPLPNGCLCQVMGEHIYDAAQISQTPSPSPRATDKRKASGVGGGESRPSKQRKLGHHGTSKKMCASPFRYCSPLFDRVADRLPLMLLYRVSHYSMLALIWSPTLP